MLYTASKENNLYSRREISEFYVRCFDNIDDLRGNLVKDSLLTNCEQLNY